MLVLKLLLCLLLCPLVLVNANPFGIKGHSPQNLWCQMYIQAPSIEMLATWFYHWSKMKGEGKESVHQLPLPLERIAARP